MSANETHSLVTSVRPTDRHLPFSTSSQAVADAETTPLEVFLATSMLATDVDTQDAKGDSKLDVRIRPILENPGPVADPGHLSVPRRRSPFRPATRRKASNGPSYSFRPARTGRTRSTAPSKRTRSMRNGASSTLPSRVPRVSASCHTPRNGWPGVGRGHPRCVGVTFSADSHRVPQPT